MLLGNGFSIGYDPCFHYGSLFEYAKANGLSPNAQKVFEKLGTNNFEGVMHLLEDADWVARQYGLLTSPPPSDLLTDLESVKSSLLDAIAKTHPEHTHRVPPKKKDACVSFLEPFYNIFSTNYDLLLYWVEMHGAPLHAKDGFDFDIEAPDAPYVVFSEHLGGSQGIFFLHGALHLYTQDGEVRKHSWTRTGRMLIESIKEALDKGQYPLFVAEGTANKKLSQIQKSGYLSYCLGKLERVEKNLVVLGLSFGASDSHIANVIADNRKLSKMYVGMFDDFESPAGLELRKNVAQIKERRSKMVAAKRSRDELEVEFFCAKSAKVWG